MLDLFVMYGSRACQRAMFLLDIAHQKRMLEAMSTLTKTQRQQLQTTLEQRQSQLLQELAASHKEQEQLVEDNEDLPREPDANQSRDRSDQEVRHAERLRDQQELQAVKAALQRMADGDYGECVNCGKKVSAERLQASPAAARCIQCQTLLEAKH